MDDCLRDEECVGILVNPWTEPSAAERSNMPRLMVVGAYYGDGLKLAYDFEGEMDDARLLKILREKHLIGRNSVRYRDELKNFDLPGWEVLDGGRKPIYVAFVPVENKQTHDNVD